MCVYIYIYVHTYALKNRRIPILNSKDLRKPHVHPGPSRLDGLTGDSTRFRRKTRALDLWDEMELTENLADGLGEGLRGDVRPRKGHQDGMVGVLLAEGSPGFELFGARLHGCGRCDLKVGTVPC